jgi:hypothetical protein
MRESLSFRRLTNSPLYKQDEEKVFLRWYWWWMEEKTKELHKLFGHGPRECPTPLLLQEAKEAFMSSLHWHVGVDRAGTLAARQVNFKEWIQGELHRFKMMIEEENTNASRLQP